MGKRIPWLIDRKVRLARVWSNRELEKFSGRFAGHVVNVSAWNDKDKEGRRYRDYFSAASSYSTTNYVAEARGMQKDLDDQIFLDLQEEVGDELRGKFDVVFNHTVLEHVFECNHAFGVLCDLTSDIVIVVVPFMQYQHAAFGDFWRFTPEGVSRLFEKNNMDLVYINYNDGPNQSIYIFAIGSKKPASWRSVREHEDNRIDRLTENVGYRVIRQSSLFYASNFTYRALRKARALVFSKSDG